MAIAFVLCFQAATAQQTEMIGKREFILHTVKPKETVYGISRQYDVPQDTIYVYNPNASHGIKVDEVLRFPSGKVVQTREKQTVKTIRHTVQQGETLYSLSRKYNVTAEDIVLMNPQVRDGLKADQVLLIPVKENIADVNVTDQEKPLDEKKTPQLSVYCDTVSSIRKDYNIALLLPFNTSRGINTKIAVEFYGGFRVAADSMARQGYTINLHVYDTRSKSDSDQVNDILAKPEFSKMDMIFGPLYSANFLPVAEFAMKNNIPVVSPFSRVATITENNPYVIKITPSEEATSEKTLRYFETFYPGANFILIDPGTRSDSVRHAVYATQMKLLAGTDTNRFHFVKLRTGGASGKLKHNVKNVVILPCSKEITVKDFLTKFNKNSKDFDISLVGQEDWMDFTIVEADYYEALKLHIPTVNFFSYTDSANFAFIRDYQELMKADPTSYSYKGYQVGCYMMSALFRYGKYTSGCLQRPVPCDCPAPFSFYRTSETGGMENRMIQMMIFENYRYRLLPY